MKMEIQDKAMALYRVVTQELGVDSMGTETIPKNCTTCARFSAEEICSLAGQRPPAKVIVAGCGYWTLDNGPAIPLRNEAPPDALPQGTRAVPPNLDAAAVATAAKGKGKGKAERVVQNGITRPKDGSVIGKIWAIADNLSMTKGAPATRAEVMQQAEAEGLKASTARSQYKNWAKYYGLNADGAAPAARATNANAATFE